MNIINLIIGLILLIPLSIIAIYGIAFTLSVLVTSLIYFMVFGAGNYIIGWLLGELIPWSIVYIISLIFAIVHTYGLVTGKIEP